MQNTKNLKLIINMIVKATANSGDEINSGNVKTIKKVKFFDQWHSAYSIPKFKRCLREHLVENYAEYFQHPHVKLWQGVAQQVPTDNDPLKNVLLAIFGYFQNESEQENANESKQENANESEQENTPKTFTRKSKFCMMFIKSITPYYNEILQYSNGGLWRTIPDRKHYGSNLFSQETHITLYPIHILIDLGELLKPDNHNESLDLSQFSPEYMARCISIILDRLHTGIPETSNGVHNTFVPLYFDAFLSRSRSIGTNAWQYVLVNIDNMPRIVITDYWRAFIDDLIVREEAPDKSGKKIVGYIDHTRHFYIDSYYKKQFLYAVDPDNILDKCTWQDGAKEVEKAKIWTQFLEDFERRLLEFFTQIKNNA